MYITANEALRLYNEANERRLAISKGCTKLMGFIGHQIRNMAKSGIGCAVFHVDIVLKSLGIDTKDEAYKPIKESTVLQLVDLGFRVVEDENEQLCVVWKSEP